MTDSTDNLTGVWLGLYSHPAALDPVSFTATLIETTSWLSGSTHEPSRFDSEPLTGTLFGSREGSLVQFTKTYDVPRRGYRNPVRYEGLVNADADEIEGRWLIRDDWTGRFLMVRSGHDAEARARKRFAEAVDDC